MHRQERESFFGHSKGVVGKRWGLLWGWFTPKPTKYCCKHIVQNQPLSHSNRLLAEARNLPAIIENSKADLALSLEGETWQRSGAPPAEGQRSKKKNGFHSLTVFCRIIFFYLIWRDERKKSDCRQKYLNGSAVLSPLCDVNEISAISRRRWWDLLDIRQNRRIFSWKGRGTNCLKFPFPVLLNLGKRNNLSIHVG